MREPEDYPTLPETRPATWDTLMLAAFLAVVIPVAWSDREYQQPKVHRGRGHALPCETLALPAGAGDWFSFTSLCKRTSPDRPGRVVREGASGGNGDESSHERKGTK